MTERSEPKYGTLRSTPDELQRYSQQAFAGNDTCSSCQNAPAHPNSDVCLGCDPVYSGVSDEPYDEPFGGGDYRWR